MPKIKNVSPFGDLDIPLLGRIFEAGTILDVYREGGTCLSGPKRRRNSSIARR